MPRLREKWRNSLTKSLEKHWLEQGFIQHLTTESDKTIWTFYLKNFENHLKNLEKSFEKFEKFI